MKKAFVFVFGIALVLFSVYSVSATPVSTIVSGTIYQDSINNVVSDANVEVICEHDNLTYTLNAISESNGEYSVTYFGDQCALNDYVTVNAQKDGLVGSQDGSITMTHQLIPGLELDVGVINVPLVPEFGVIAGLVALIGGLGVFFYVRND